jgi:DNA mismatch repair ATPase MutL
LLLKNEFIGQIENKFLVSVAQGIILLWDQHALHERIRLEQLQIKFLSAPGETCSVKSCPTPEKLSLNLSRIQLEILKESESKLKQYGLVLAGTRQ